MHLSFAKILNSLPYKYRTFCNLLTTSLEITPRFNSHNI
uniref:Uncharacterized protein n=1 Tax=Anguilla anguilla TaxID=7936 RepID=A0A0E9V5P4_ANGAN